MLIAQIFYFGMLVLFWNLVGTPLNVLFLLVAVLPYLAGAAQLAFGIEATVWDRPNAALEPVAAPVAAPEPLPVNVIPFRPSVKPLIEGLDGEGFDEQATSPSG